MREVVLLLEMVFNIGEKLVCSGAATLLASCNKISPKERAIAVNNDVGEGSRFLQTTSSQRLRLHETLALPRD